MQQQNDEHLLDIAAIFSRYVPGLRDKGTRTHGGEWCGKCPLPGCTSRDDGFLLWPHRPMGDGPLWWCRKCERSGRLRTFLREVDPEHYAGLCKEFGMSIDGEYEPPIKPPPPALTEGQNMVWTLRALEMALDAKKRLWDGSDASNAALNWLRRRKFRDETIASRGYGFLAQSEWQEPALWGMLPQVERGSKRETVWVPQGILIPWLAYGNEIVKLNVRRPDKVVQKEVAMGQPKKKYVQVKGSSQHLLYGAWSFSEEWPVMLVEGEFERDILRQEIGNGYPINLFATGSVYASQSLENVALLRRAPLVLVAFNNDEAGTGGALDWWLSMLPNARPWLPPIPGVDINEMVIAGDDVRTWLEQGLTHTRATMFAVNANDCARSSTTRAVVSAVNNAPYAAAEIKRETMRCDCGARAVLRARGAEGRRRSWCCRCALVGYFGGDNPLHEVLFYEAPGHRLEALVSLPGKQLVQTVQFEPTSESGKQQLTEACLRLLLALWQQQTALPKLRDLLSCFACEVSPTHYDLHGRLWCADHAQPGAGKLTPGEFSLPLEGDDPTEGDNGAVCFMCGEAMSAFDRHGRLYCDGCEPPLPGLSQDEVAMLFGRTHKRCAVHACQQQAVHERACGADRSNDKTALGWCREHERRADVLDWLSALGWAKIPYGQGKFLLPGRDWQVAFVRSCASAEFFEVLEAVYRRIKHYPDPVPEVASKRARELQETHKEDVMRCSYVACHAPAVYIDGFGNGWCDAPGCRSRYLYMQATIELNFPAVIYGDRSGAGGTRVLLGVGAGEEAHLHFARQANWREVEAATAAVLKQQQHQQQYTQAG